MSRVIQGIYREACQAIKSSLTERTRVASSTLFASRGKAGFLLRLLGHSYFFSRRQLLWETRRRRYFIQDRRVVQDMTLSG